MAGCSKSESPQNPAQVAGSEVKSILLSQTIAQADACERALKNSGAKILYKNDSGLFMTDKTVRDLAGVEKCGAEVRDNAKVELNTAPAVTRDGRKMELSTLLRLIPAEEMGARTFVKNNPTFDGRNVVVAVLDTGVEVDHPMLSKTTTGQIKVVDFEDFSGEGKVVTESAKISPEGTIPSSNGDYMATSTMSGTDHRFGMFAGSSLAYSDAVSAQDEFTDLGVVSYKTTAGVRVVRVDTNNDKNFDDEAELADYKNAPAFTKIGVKRSLTVTVKVSDDGQHLNLCFDDGSHGTHVAGIATGYQPDGLQGVAPGAQVVAVKIGDNRLAGGSTTTASMMLAIDYAVQSKAQVVNLSYGIRAGGNAGKSAIDQYVDKVAREKGMIFSISAGNEGPGLLTIGVPAGADLAITNGAYVSKQTARDNYGYLAVEDDTTWYFSSVGPRLDGGWKPTLLSPGSALSSVPLWSGVHGNFRGTSMASPETTGGLALLLSAAAQSKLLTDRAAITRAVYDGARKVEGLSLVEQGHGLMNIPDSFAQLAKMSKSPIEYTLSVNSPTAPNGRGKGIYVRSRLGMSNLFTVTATPVLPPGVKPGEVPLRTLRMVTSADWIRTPESLWIQGAAKTFQVDLDRAGIAQPGLYSEKLVAIDETDGSVAFEVPVTIVTPHLLDDTSRHQFNKETQIRVGQTLRYFLEVPAGTTAVQLELSTDGPFVWGQLLDAEGRKIVELRDSESSSPMPAVEGQANLIRPGVYELDLIAPATNQRHAKVSVNVTLFSLTATLEPQSESGKQEVLVQNNYEALKIVPKIEHRSDEKRYPFTIAGNSATLALKVDAASREAYSSISLEVSTAKSLYDLMTDYPFRVFDAKKAMIAAGGMELVSPIDISGLADLPEGDVSVEIQGAFTKAPPKEWTIQIKESRLLKESVTLSTGSRTLIEQGQQVSVMADMTKMSKGGEGYKACATLSLTTPSGRVIQDVPLCE